MNIQRDLERENIMNAHTFESRECQALIHALAKKVTVLEERKRLSLKQKQKRP